MNPEDMDKGEPSVAAVLDDQNPNLSGTEKGKVTCSINGQPSSDVKALDYVINALILPQEMDILEK